MTFKNASGTWLVITVGLLLLSCKAQAQQKPTFPQIDSLSYHAWLAEDWGKVLEYTNAGLNAGYDYYYLRMRAGIAQLNKSHPVQATTHFRKALEFNQNDPIALENLYSSLYFSGQLAEARLMAAKNSPALRKRLGIPARRLITSAFIETGYMVNSRADSLLAYRPDADLAHGYLIPSYWYLSAGVNLQTGKRFSGTISTNILSFAATQQFLIRNLAAQTFDVPYDQRSIYLSGNCYLGKGFSFGLAGQVISYTVPLYTLAAGENGGSYVQNAYAYRDLALNAALVKWFPYATVSLAADANRLKNLWYKQAQLELTIYPAGNINTWIKLGGTWVSDSLNPNGRTIVHATAGQRLFRSVCIEGDYFYGDIRNISEQSAYVVFNNFDPIKTRMGINFLAYRILPHLDLSIRYQFTIRTASWQTYRNSQYLGDQQLDYPVHSIIGGLTWRF